MTPRAFVLVAVVFLGSAAACFVDIPPLAVRAEDASPDVVDLPDSTTVVDATTDTDDPDSNACAPGAFAKPLRSFDATPAANGRFCNLDGALTRGDGQVAGLDRNDDTSNVFLASVGVTTCVGVEIAPRVLVDVVVAAAAAEMGCDVRCVVGSGGCDSHQWVEVFAAPPGADWVHLGQVETTYTMTEYTVAVPMTLPAIDRIAVCRSDGSKDRDDEIVDFIGPRCR